LLGPDTPLHYTVQLRDRISVKKNSVRRLLALAGGWFPTFVAIALPVTFFPFLSDSFILPRASIVIAAACVGIGLALLTSGGPRLGSLRWPLIAAAAALLLAFAFSISWPLSLAGSYTRYESLPMRLAYLGLLASAVWLLRTEVQRQAVVAGFVFGVSIVSLIAIGQAFAQVPFRPDGNLGNANLLAGLVAMGIPLAVDRGVRGGLFVLAWWAAALVMAATMLVTTSRSGGLGAVAGVLALGVLTLRGRPAIVAAGVWAGAMATAFALIQLTPLHGLNNDPASLRLGLWQDGLRMVAARPLTGWGEDTTGLAFGQFLSHDYADFVTFDRIHSGPLDVAATQGVLGLAALSWVLFVLGRGAWANRFTGNVGALAAALVGYTVWVSLNFDWAPATGGFWLLAGTMWSQCTIPVPPGEQSVGEARASAPSSPGSARRDRERGKAAARAVAAVALAIAAIGLAAFPVLADAWYYRGRPDLAVQVDPLQAQYHWSLGGITGLRRAADLGETEPGLYVTLGDAELRLGNRDRARAAYRRALQIDPYYGPAAQRLIDMGPG